MQAPPKPKSPLGHYRLLSPTAGVRVSPICLGTMNFGTAWGSMLGECSKEDTFKILDHYYEKGGNFIDTANAYHMGQSEEWLGEWMKERGNRDELVIATKYTGLLPGPSQKIRVNYSGNQIKSLLLSFEASLAKMQTSYVDILYIHWWDFTTSVEEVMQALNRLVNSGKVHYLGVSDSPAWVALKANLYAKQHGLVQFSVYQGLYNAATRDCEREILPVCEDTGMAFIPYGAQGGGEFKTKEQRESLAQRGEGRKMPVDQGGAKYVKTTEVLDGIGQKTGKKITQVALAWTMTRAPYVFPVIGVRKLDYLKDAIDALTIKLSDEECDQISRSSGFEPGFPITFTFQHWNTSIDYQPSMTTKDIGLCHMGGPLDIVEKPKSIPFHSKEDSETAE